MSMPCLFVNIVEMNIKIKTYSILVVFRYLFCPQLILSILEVFNFINTCNKSKCKLVSYLMLTVIECRSKLLIILLQHSFTVVQ